MSENLDRVKDYLLDLGLTIVAENEAEELVVVDDEDKGIKQLVIDCEPPIVVLEQLIAEVPAEPRDLYVRLLQMNNTLVHGAFVLDETAERIFYRDTLQLAHLDLNFAALTVGSPCTVKDLPVTTTTTLASPTSSLSVLVGNSPSTT